MYEKFEVSEINSGKMKNQEWEKTYKYSKSKRYSRKEWEIGLLQHGDDWNQTYQILIIEVS